MVSNATVTADELLKFRAYAVFLYLLQYYCHNERFAPLANGDYAITRRVGAFDFFHNIKVGICLVIFSSSFVHCQSVCYSAKRKLWICETASLVKSTMCYNAFGTQQGLELSFKNRSKLTYSALIPCEVYWNQRNSNIPYCSHDLCAIFDIPYYIILHIYISIFSTYRGFAI